MSKVAVEQRTAGPAVHRCVLLMVLFHRQENRHFIPTGKKRVIVSYIKLDWRLNYLPSYCRYDKNS